MYSYLLFNRLYIPCKLSIKKEKKEKHVRVVLSECTEYYRHLVGTHSMGLVGQFPTTLKMSLLSFLRELSVFGTIIILDMKGANEVNRQYFQQAVLLCLLKALYYAGFLFIYFFK